jgi:hypothetical protein
MRAVFPELKKPDIRGRPSSDVSDEEVNVFLAFIENNAMGSPRALAETYSKL